MTFLAEYVEQWCSVCIRAADNNTVEVAAGSARSGLVSPRWRPQRNFSPGFSLLPGLEVARALRGGFEVFHRAA